MTYIPNIRGERIAGSLTGITSISATTISATTYYGSGANLTGLPNPSVKDYVYVSPNGNDSGLGTMGSPYLTPTKAASVAISGQTIYWMTGTYIPNNNCHIDGVNHILDNVTIYATGSTIFNTTNSTLDLHIEGIGTCNVINGGVFEFISQSALTSHNIYVKNIKFSSLSTTSGNVIRSETNNGFGIQFDDCVFNQTQSTNNTIFSSLVSYSKIVINNSIINISSAFSTPNGNFLNTSNGSNRMTYYTNNVIVNKTSTGYYLYQSGYFVDINQNSIINNTSNSQMCIYAAINSDLYNGKIISNSLVLWNNPYTKVTKLSGIFKYINFYSPSTTNTYDVFYHYSGNFERCTFGSGGATDVHYVSGNLIDCTISSSNVSSIFIEGNISTLNAIFNLYGKIYFNCVYKGYALYMNTNCKLYVNSLTRIIEIGGSPAFNGITVVGDSTLIMNGGLIYCTDNSLPISIASGKLLTVINYGDVFCNKSPMVGGSGTYVRTITGGGDFVYDINGE